MDKDLKKCIYIVIGIVILTYLVHFFMINSQAISWNGSNPCVLMPLNFGACV